MTYVGGLGIYRNGGQQTGSKFAIELFAIIEGSAAEIKRPLIGLASDAECPSIIEKMVNPGRAEFGVSKHIIKRPEE